jgi:hypothetical protein
VNDEHAKFLLHYCISKFCYIGKLAYLSMPKFLASCHYNEEEISWHFKENIGDWPVQMNGNKFATGQILKKPVEVVKGRIYFSWLSSKVSRTLTRTSLQTSICSVHLFKQPLAILGRQYTHKHS